MTRQITMALVAAAAALLLATGCATTSAESLDEAFGEAVRHNTAQQTINPEAGEQEAEATGLDGRKGERALERYRTARPDADRGSLITR